MSDDPYAAGREAHDTGKPETANPYPDLSNAALSWNDGWNEAADEAADERNDSD